MSLPYVTSPGSIDKALAGIKTAAVPDRVSQDFVKTILKVQGGSGDQITSFLKKIGFANIDGSPTDLYKKFRNPSSSGSSVATAIKTAYAALYIRNEFAHELNDEQLLGLVVEETGQPHDSNTVKLIVNCFRHLKAFANFSDTVATSTTAVSAPQTNDHTSSDKTRSPNGSSNNSFGLNLGYTINLNLPATSDIEVFDAIFRSLKEHLLNNQDG